MKFMPLLTVAALAIAIVAAVFAIWPVVGDAPWLDDAPAVSDSGTDTVRCEGALRYRDTIIAAGPYAAGIGGVANIAGNPDGVRDYDAQLAKAEGEIQRYC